MTETFEAWQCIGCGRLEGPAQCIGVCQDRKVELVNAADYLAVTARLAAMEEVVRRIALIHPRNGEWERTWNALQEQARQVLASRPSEPSPAPGSPKSPAETA